MINDIIKKLNKNIKDIDDILYEENNYEKKYDEFWKDIIECNGEINLCQLKKELYDYSILIDNVTKVYTHATNYVLSKTNYSAEIVISQIEEAQKNDLKHDLENFIDDMKIEGKEMFLENDLREYFDI